MGRYSKFILKSIKENFEAGEKYETEGFPDLNYEVGNTSGLDVAPGVPSAMDERIGSLSQRGGSVMEVIINNPATFQLDKDRMFNVINQLGINISIHSNPDIGYTNPNRQAGGGYDPTHAYFTRYLEQFAIFKKEAEVRAEDEENFGFEIQRINPHISTSRLPALEEERPGDTGLDPFGYSLTDLKKDVMDEKDEKGQNIFQNEDFLRRLFRTFMLDFLEGNEDRYYQQLFSDYSEKFNRDWNDARDEVLNNIYRSRSEAEEDSVEEKATLVGIAGRADAETSTRWYDELDRELDSPVDVTGYKGGGGRGYPRDQIATLEDLDEFIRKEISMNYGLNQLGRLPEVYMLIREDELERIATQRPAGASDLSGLGADLRDEIKKPLEDALDSLWTTKEEKGEPLIPVNQKTQAIARHFEIAQQRLIERAFESEKEDIRDSAEKVVSGNTEYFENGEEDPEELHLKFLQRITQQFQNQMWMESNIMYKIIPAWMDVADEDEYDGHEGWEAPKFVWELLVKRKWEEKKGYDIDLTEPRGKEDEDIGYLDLLENSREFQADVAAASAACYVWGHFTQKEGHFEVTNEKYVDDIETDTTWIEWMNRFGIGVNLEAMPGSPQQMYKIWRPKDIVAAARAVNITARNKLDEIHEDLDEMPAKFTLDLEHTATFGLDPWKTMEELIEQEKDLADSPLADKYNLKVDADKPLAKVLRMWHLMRAGVETSQSQTLHGPWDRGDTQLYEWLYKMVDAGFCRNPDETGYIMYEVGGDDRGTVYTARIAMNLIELGVSPKDLDPTNVDPSKKEYGDEKEALMARFFGMDKSTYDREWAKIEEHAFDPLDGLLEAEGFDFTWSGQGAIEEGSNRPQEWKQEEFR